MKKTKLYKPVLGHLLYKYFKIETNAYKRWWKKYCKQIQFELDTQYC